MIPIAPCKRRRRSWASSPKCCKLYNVAKRGYFGVNHRTGLTQGSQGLTMEGQALWRARAETRKLGKMGKGPHGPPEGPRGARRYPYGSVPNRSFSSRNRIFFPANLDPNQDRRTCSENPNSASDGFRRFPSEIRYFRNSPQSCRLIWGVSPGPYRPIWMGTDTYGYQKWPPKALSLVPGPLSPAQGPWPLVHGPWSIVRGPVRGPWSLVGAPGPWSLVPASGPLSLVPSPWYVVPGPLFLVPEPWALVAGG